MAEDNPSGGRLESAANAAAADLSERITRLEAIVDALPVLVSYVDRDQRYRFNNRSYEHWFGCSRDEITGRHIRDVLGKDAYRALKPQIDRALGGERFSFEALVPYKGGGPRNVHIEYVPDRGPDGSVSGYLAMVQDITARKATEEALRQSEERLRRVLETDAVGVIFFSHDGRVIGANDAFLTMTGYTRAEIAAGELDWRRMTPPEWVAASEAQMEKLAATGRIGPYEKEYVLADGSRRWMLFAGRDLGDGTIAEYCLDITSSKRTEEALRDSEERLRMVVETAVDAIVLINDEGRILAFNPAAERMFGYSHAEVIGENVKLLMPDPHKARHDSYISAYRKTGKAKIIGIGREVEGRRKDGSQFSLGLSIAEGRDGRGRRFFTGIMRDVTDLKIAEEQLREESHNLEILNRVGSALAGELNLERVVQMVTDAGVELTGAQFGAFFYNVINADGEAYMLYTLSGADRSQFEKFGMPRNTEVFAPTFGGEGIVRSDDITKDPRYGRNWPHKGMPKGHLPVVSYLAVPVAGRSGEVIGGLFFGHPEPGRFEPRHERLMEGIAAQAAIAIDNARLFGAAQHEIEQRVKAEEALTALNETLESRVADEIDRRAQAEEVLRQTQKMETVGQLSGGIAHDFNNLLQVIHGNLTILQHALPKNEAKWQRSVANALTGTERAAALTKRLLAFSRRQPLDPRPVDINRLILDMTEMLHRTLGETIVIETRLSADVPSALVDGNQLENAILNLAINARDAMPSGGRLEICTNAAELDGSHCDMNPDVTPGRYVCIEVRDDGQGMSEEIRARAVEPFFSTKEVGEGTGLGLSMVYGFVCQSGGHFVLNSREGVGTTVELYLPCSDSAAHDRTLAASVDELPRGSGERVLLCEDDEDVRLFSSETLADLGYEVIEARDSASALAALKEQGPIDLLFTDVVLPGGTTGADLAREARKLQPDLKILYTTGYARSALDKEQRTDKGVDVLLKPFAVDDLAGKVRKMLQS
jgi:PAS domain S-box-containing protein